MIYRAILVGWETVGSEHGASRMLDSDFVLWLGWPLVLVQSTVLAPVITFPKWAFPQMALLVLGR
jgi:hypothetical protein